MPDLFDCDRCGLPLAITRERQQSCLPTPTGVTTRTEHADGVWCETFQPRPA